MTIRLWSAVIGVCLLTANGCKKKQESLPISDKQLVPLLVDAQLIEAALRSMSAHTRDSLTLVLYEQLFAKHRTTRQDFDKTMIILSQNPEMMMALLNQVETSLGAASQPKNR